eukprot:2907817-Alexandrium_andersonii.AAC.1
MAALSHRWGQMSASQKAPFLAKASATSSIRARVRDMPVTGYTDVQSMQGLSQSQKSRLSSSLVSKSIKNVLDHPAWGR